MAQETKSPFAAMLGGDKKKSVVELHKEKLETEGFEVLEQALEV